MLHALRYWGNIMNGWAVMSFVLAIGAANAAVSGPPEQPIPVRVGQGARQDRPAHAALRYNVASTFGCHSISESSSAACLLLAIHVIHMTEKPMIAPGAPN